ncbi:hypothetical protein LCGC14_2737110, partial [marine sediment metagenome]
ENYAETYAGGAVSDCTDNADSGCGLWWHCHQAGPEWQG